MHLIPLIDLNLRLTRMFDINDHSRVELFFEGYNMLNHVTKTGGATADDERLDLPRTDALDARQLQWGARFRF